MVPASSASQARKADVEAWCPCSRQILLIADGSVSPQFGTALQEPSAYWGWLLGSLLRSGR